jgi:hypothetical protein
LVVLTPATALATHPLQVEDTGTEGKGNYLFEITGDYLKDNDIKATQVTGVVTAGAGKHTDLSIEAPYLMLDPSPALGGYTSGHGDVRLKLKHRLFNNEVRQSMAYLLFIDLPTGDVEKGLGTNNVVWGGRLIDSQACGDYVFHANLGYETFGRDVKRWHFAENYAITFGLAAERGVTDSLRFLAELAGESRKEPKEATPYSRPFTVLAGLIYDVSKSWYVDLGARAGLNKYAEDYSVLAGTAWRF